MAGGEGGEGFGAINRMKCGGRGEGIFIFSLRWCTTVDS